MKNLFAFPIICLIVLAAFISGFSSNDNNPNTKIDKGKIHITKSAPYIEKGPVLNFLLYTLYESFEGYVFPPPGWAKINVATGSTGWDLDSAGETPVPGFYGGELYCPSNGGTHLAFCNYITGGTNSDDQWLCTPLLGNITTGDSLMFWMRKYGSYLDHMDIMISTTTQTPPSAYTTLIQLLTFQPEDSGYVYYTYDIGSLVPQGSNIYIAWRQWVLNNDSTGSSFSLDLVSVTAPIGIRNIHFGEPNSYKLEQNYPNPFNPSTKITYSIEKDGLVNLTVYDILGRQVAVIVNTNELAGNYTVNFDASKLSSGIYFYKLTSGSFTDVKKMNLIK